jgi:hypothetical protein
MATPKRNSGRKRKSLGVVAVSKAIIRLWVGMMIIKMLALLVLLMASEDIYAQQSINRHPDIYVVYEERSSRWRTRENPQLSSSASSGLSGGSSAQNTENSNNLGSAPTRSPEPDAGSTNVSHARKSSGSANSRRDYRLREHP